MKFECTFWNPESQLDIGETEYIEADNKTEALKTMLKGKTAPEAYEQIKL
tara:strand:+ start:199 stop:348 length:150 start_codon:yes stop_codon:yes gene_type:complete